MLSPLLTAQLPWRYLSHAVVPHPEEDHLIMDGRTPPQKLSPNLLAWLLEAMASVDIPEAHWQDLARDEVLWNKHVRQTDEDRDAQRKALFELHCDEDPAHHARALALAAFPASQEQPPMSPFSPAAHLSSPGSLVLPSPRLTPWLEGPLSTPVVSSKGTPISTRRRDYVLGGGVSHPKTTAWEGPACEGGGPAGLQDLRRPKLP